MQAELQAEQDADQEMYDKMVCWCGTNDKEKTKAIADANQAIDDLGAAIEENTALASTREVELGALAKQTGGALVQQEALLQVAQVLRRRPGMAESSVAP